MVTRSHERRLAAILSADVHGFSRLMAGDEIGTTQQLARCRAIFRSHSERHHGRVVDDVGDAVLVEFPSVFEAVPCAVELQAELAQANAERPVDERMSFRIGVHLGDVIAQGERISGTGVNVAARVQALAEPGGISVTGAVYDQLEGHTELRFTRQGVHRLRNIPKPVRVYRVAHSTEASSVSRASAILRWAARFAAVAALGGTAVWLGARGTSLPEVSAVPGGGVGSLAVPSGKGDEPLLWYLEAPTSAPLEFRLHRVDPLEPIAATRLPAPDELGVQKLRLEDHAIRLERGGLYFWFVKEVHDPQDPTQDEMLGGGLIRAGTAGG